MTILLTVPWTNFHSGNWHSRVHSQVRQYLLWTGPGTSEFARILALPLRILVLIILRVRLPIWMTLPHWATVDNLPNGTPSRWRRSPQCRWAAMNLSLIIASWARLPMSPNPHAARVPSSVANIAGSIPGQQIALSNRRRTTASLPGEL